MLRKHYIGDHIDEEPEAEYIPIFLTLRKGLVK